VAAFVAETVVGATAGCVLAVPGGSRRFPEISDRYRVLLVLDEIIG
jgi:adenosylmethionine-8-amino-7-oxononanoate aminotransferase